MSVNNSTASGIQSFPLWITIRAATRRRRFLGNGHHVVLADDGFKQWSPTAKPVQNEGGQNHGQHSQVKLWSITLFFHILSLTYQWNHIILNSMIPTIYSTVPVHSTVNTRGLIISPGVFGRVFLNAICPEVDSTHSIITSRQRVEA